MKELKDWLENGEYLPDIMRDFHDRKNIFKCMHTLYQGSEPRDYNVPKWIDGHIYVVDWFLWYMGSRGYTLQKNRSNVDFRKFENISDLKEYQGP